MAEQYTPTNAPNALNNGKVDKLNKCQSTVIMVAACGALLTGLVMLSIQIVALTLNNPRDSYDYVSHGIWAGVFTEISAIICLLAVVSKKTATMMISGTIMAFYSSSACLVSVVLSSLSISYGSCNLSEKQCDTWTDIEWTLNGFSFCALCFNIVLTLATALSINAYTVKINTLNRPLKISFVSIILWGVASIGLQTAALCTNDTSIARGLVGQGIWAGVFYAITGTLGLMQDNTKKLHVSLSAVFSVLSGLFSIYIVVDSGITLSLDDCDPLIYPCDHWRGVEWSLMTFNVVAFTEATFLVFLLCIVLSQKRLLIL